jgi:DNA polymerase elongation subunit (family B)
VFIDIFNERIALKHKENPTPEDDGIQKADKLVLNTTFGASGNKWLDLYDPYMCTSVCRVGQIFLGALAHKIFKTIKHAKIVQTNTDGILVYLPRSELPVLDKLQQEWTNVSGINMERDEVLKIWQRDVNNYLMVIEKKGKEKIKCKGGWLNTDYYRPGSVKTAAANRFVCAKAVIDYLTKGKDIVESIVNNNNLFDFIIVCTKGPTFRGVVQRMSNGTEVELFKANRVIASKDTSRGMIYKYKMYKGNIQYNKMPDVPEHCKLVNEDLNSYDFNDIKKELDYMYYIEECANLLDKEFYQLKGTNIFKTNQFNYFNND